MTNGYRSLGIAALAAALFIAFGLGAYWTGLPYPEERYQSYQESDDKEDGPLASVSNVDSPIVERTPCRDPKGQAESELCAQWRAAKAAEKSADWTVYAFWATLVGMALLTWQLMLTREAVKDTSDATRAMRESNEIIRTVEDASIVVSIVETTYHPNDGFFISVEFSNIGRSPGIMHSICADDDLVYLERPIVAGEKIRQNEICFIPWELDPPCHICFDFVDGMPEDFVLIVEQTTPLRGRFVTEIPCNYMLTKDGWKAISFFHERREIQDKQPD